MDVSDLPRPVGFVLGGGGSLGAIQAGMLQALHEHLVVADLVVGTSVGAMNGAAVAASPMQAAARLTRAWSGVRRSMIFPGSVITQARTLQQTRTSLYSSHGLAATLASQFGTSGMIEDLQLPFAVVATDVATSQAHVLTSGPLVPALLASSALPGIYPSVTVEGRELYDGGLVANVPVRQAVALGAASLVVLDCVAPGRVPEPPRTMAETLLFATFVAIRTQAVLETSVAAASLPVLYLPGVTGRRVSPGDFKQSGSLIAGAYESTSAFLDTVVVDGPGLYQAPVM